MSSSSTCIRASYSDEEKTVTFEEAEGRYPFREEWNLIFVRKDQIPLEMHVRYNGKQSCYPLLAEGIFRGV